MSDVTRERERQRFIDSCTQRDMANGPMPTKELLERLDIGLSALKEAIANPNERRLPMVGADCLRGALIRLSQAYSDPQVSAKVYELVSLTTDIPSSRTMDYEDALAHIKLLEQALEDIKVIAIQAMTEPSPMPNALTWDCFVRIRNVVDHAQARLQQDTEYHSQG